MKRAYHIVALCLICTSLMAQKKANIKPNAILAIKQGEWLLKVVPLTLVQPEGAFTIGTEYRFNRFWATSVDVGYVFPNTIIQSYSSRGSFKGFTIRPGIRKYTGSKLRNYWEVEMMYKRVTETTSGSVGFNCVNNIAAFEEVRDFSKLKQVFITNVKLGTLFSLSQDNNNAMLELFVGIGARFKEKSFIGLPKNSCNIIEDNFDIIVGPYNKLLVEGNISLGLRVVFRLKKEQNKTNNDTD
jgi:hypothetical protein